MLRLWKLRKINWFPPLKCSEVIKKEKGLDLSEAETIVAVGRGVKSEKDLEMIYEFAEKIGATVACTRPGIEAGWFDARLQIGLSGRTVKPKLIIALGISGAVSVCRRDAEFGIHYRH